MADVQFSFVPPRIERKAKSFLVIAPRIIINDELRMMRLEEYLQVEFPDYAFVMAPENDLPGNQSAVAVLLDKNGASPFPPEEAERVAGYVCEAMQAFVDYQKRAH